MFGASVALVGQRLRRRFSCWLVVCSFGLVLCSGCPFQLLPPNNFRLITTEPSGAYPPFIHFTHGTFLETENRCVAVLSGARADVLFDLNGPSNRFELMFRNGNDRALYERIGTYGPLRDGVLAAKPFGITWRRAGKILRGAVDVYVGQSERRAIGTSFEHYPRAMRVVGYVIIPPSETVDHPLATLFSPNALNGEISYPDLHTLEPSTGSSRLSEMRTRLPTLPLIDVEYLLPDTVKAVFRPETF